MGSQPSGKIMILLVLIVSPARPVQIAKDNNVPQTPKEKNVPSTNHGNYILYDLSSLIRKSERNGSIDAILDAYPSEYKISKFYYEIDATIDNKTCYWFNDTFWSKSHSCKYFGITEHSIVGTFSRNKIASISNARNLSVMKPSDFKIRDALPINNSFVDFVIVSLNDELPCYGLMDNLKLYVNYQLSLFEFKQNDTRKFGIEYTESFVEQCEEDNENYALDFHLIKKMILRIELTPLSTMLSYGFFSKLMNSLVSRNRRFVQKICPNCAVYIRLVTKNWETSISENNFERYEALVASYFTAWHIESFRKDIYIVSPVRNVTILKHNDFVKTMVTAGISTNGVRSSGDDHVYCSLHTILKQAQLVFSKVLLSVNLQEIDDLCSLVNKKCWNATSIKDGSVDLYLYNFLSDGGKFLEWTNGRMCTPQINSKLGIIYFDMRRISISSAVNKSNYITTAVNNLHAKNIQVGGTTYAFINAAQENISCFDRQNIEYICQHWNKLTQIVIYCAIRITKQEQLLRMISDLHDNMQQYENKCSGTTFVPQIFIIFRETKNVDWFSKLRTWLYCNVNVESLHEYYQAIFSFAKIHNWKEMAISPALDQRGFAWWKYVDKYKNINISTTSFPLFLRTNSEKSADGEQLPMTYPCIQEMKDAAQLGIKFQENRHLGVSFDIGLRPESSSLTDAELKTALLFALEKFSAVQLIARNAAEFGQVTSVLTLSFLNAVKSSRQHLSVDKPLVYITVPLTQLLNHSDSIARGIESESIGILVSEWEQEYSHLNHKDAGMLSVQLEKKSFVNFGITIQNCSHEVNLQLERVKKLPYFQMLSCIVCNITLSTLEFHRNDFIYKHAEPLFYIKSYMEATLYDDNNEKGRKVEVMFQLNLEANKCSSLYNLNTFLKQMNEINQHSSAYQIGYFIGRAFDKEHLAVENCAFSWWRVQKYSDLTNVSAYVDREEELFGRPTMIRIELPRENENKLNVVNHDAIPILYYVVVIALVVVVTLLLVFFIFWFQARRAKNAFLTQKEISQFYNGEDQDGMMMTSSMDCPDTIYMQFDILYEIPLRNIELGLRIGSGEFGVVCKGVLADRGEVAVKIPRSDSGKDHFKSALSELKILCYIGHHTNIVSFLGAHTKQIGKGKLYIVTEYCERGSLQGYLRELQSPQVSSTDSETVPTVVDLGQLCVFSVQIASGMEYVAEKRVVHADLATRNVLLTSELTCKVADFGLSRKLYEMGEYVKTSKEPLPWRWMAPESLKNMEFTTKSDVWSYGVTVWEIFSLGMVPYTGRSWTQDFVTELENGLRIEKAQRASNEIHKKLMDCWKASLNERPTFTDLKQFFTELRTQEYLNFNE